MKNVLICIDRDGTIIYDKKKRPRYYIGSQSDWKSKIKFLKDVVKGIKLLNKKLPNAQIYVITNQPGIAINNLKLLTFKRATEVCGEVVRRLKKKGAMTKGCLICPHAIPKYVKTHPEYKFDKKLEVKDNLGPETLVEFNEIELDAVCVPNTPPVVGVTDSNDVGLTNLGCP